MSTEILKTKTLLVTSYCGKARNDNGTRIRLQINSNQDGQQYVTVGIEEIKDLSKIFAEYLQEYNKNT